MLNPQNNTSQEMSQHDSALSQSSQQSSGKGFDHATMTGIGDGRTDIVQAWDVYCLSPN